MFCSQDVVVRSGRRIQRAYFLQFSVTIRIVAERSNGDIFSRPTD